MTANDEILKRVYEINQELGAFDSEKKSDSDSSNEEILEDKDIDNSPVYILENSIDDAQELNSLREAIESKKQEQEAKQKEIDEVEAKKDELCKEIGIINNGEKHNEVALNLKKLKDVNDELAQKKRELEDLYRELRDLEGKGQLLTSTIRTMVEKMTKEYKEKVEAYTRLVNSYVESSNSKEYEEAMKLVEELNGYKEFENFDAILGKTSKPEEVKEEVKEEVVKEEKETVIPTEPKVEESLTEVKVDQIDTDEPKKVEDLTIDKEFPAESNIAPVEENIPEIKEETPNLSFDNIKVEEETPAVTEQVPEVPSAPVVEEKPAIEMTIYLDRSSKIADSTKKGIADTIETFASKIDGPAVATLKLSTKNA